MAEVAVRSVIDRLFSLLNGEVKLLTGLHKQVEDIKVELQFIASFLRDADARAEIDDEGNHGIKTWVKCVRQQAFCIEDIIDEYMLHFAKHRNQHGVIAFLWKIGHSINNFRKRHEIAREIQRIRTSLREIGEQKNRYNFSSSVVQGRHSNGDPRVGLHFVEDDELVGIDSPRNELAFSLIHGASVRTVISVVGMGGVGKTTLAKKVYDEEAVRGHFDCHAWIPVSQTYKVDQLLRTMIKRLYVARKEHPPNGIGAMDEDLLISHSRKYLRGKRFFVVFDDIWREDFWRDVEHALLDNDKGSRIMITTRNIDVAEFCKKSALLRVHELNPLPQKLGQELLIKKAFQFEEEKQCDSKLEQLSLDIVKRCRGLPLAIVAIGGLLSTKGTDVLQWMSLCNNLSALLESSPHLICIKTILSFSYLDLPYYLKSCFLYLGMFPEDYSMNCATLIRLWVAEGFVKEKQGETLEEIGGKYLTELIHRNLVQIDSTDFLGRVRRCRVHDLMREVILSKLEELNLIETSTEKLIEYGEIARHLSVHNKPKFISTECISKAQTRSIVFFEVSELPMSLFTTVFANFKLLKVLHFEGAPLSNIPEELGNMLHLKYLSVRDTKVKMLPNSIVKLQSLKTLDLKRSLVLKLPVKFHRLCNLQNLLAYSVDNDSDYNIDTRKGIKIYGNLGSLESLEKLYFVDMEARNETKKGATFISELGKLKKLRKLGITKLKSEDGMALCAALEMMSHLQSLRVYSAKEDEFLQLQSISSPPLLLKRLSLRGRLEKLPDWIPKLQNLAKVRLFWSRLADDPFKILGVLPYLIEFSTYKGYDGQVLHFEKQHFQKLKRLGLVCLNGVNRFIIDNGALPLLESLSIGPIPQLEEVPYGISYLRSLKCLWFNDMSKEFARGMLPNGGSDHFKVQHVPHICFTYTTRGTRYDTFKLGDSRLLEYLQS